MEAAEARAVYSIILAIPFLKPLETILLRSEREVRVEAVFLTARMASTAPHSVEPPSAVAAEDNEGRLTVSQAVQAAARATMALAEQESQAKGSTVEPVTPSREPAEGAELQRPAKTATWAIGVMAETAGLDSTRAICWEQVSATVAFSPEVVAEASATKAELKPQEPHPWKGLATLQQWMAAKQGLQILYFL